MKTDSLHLRSSIPAKTLLAALCLTGLTHRAVLAGIITTDNFGSGANAFSIDFATIGNAGNAKDAGAGGGSYSSPYGGVSYTYRMGVTEVPQVWIDKATNLGLSNVTAGAWTGNKPAADMSWYEAAAFVNFLNTSTGHQAAYQINAGVTALTLWSTTDAWQLDGQNLYRHKDAYYFLPNEDEWYKAAFHKNDGVTANYWDYATGSNTIPTQVTGGTTVGTAVYNFGGPGLPADVDNDGGLSPYGTRGQNGNVVEWLESAEDGLNNQPGEIRVRRAGSYTSGEPVLRSSDRSNNSPTQEVHTVGLRVASIEPIPEPGTMLFGLACIGVAAMCRRRACAASNAETFLRR